MKQYKATTPQYYVVKQFGAYSDKSNADDLLRKLKASDPDGYYKIMKVAK